MARPSFKKGREYAELLISALLAYSAGEVDIKIYGQLSINPAKTNLAPAALRVKAELMALVNLVKIYVISKNLPIEQQKIIKKFVQLTDSQQETEIKNAITCLLTLEIVKEERAQGDNEKKRSFLLPLLYSPIDDQQKQNNLKWLWEKWEKARKQNKNNNSADDLKNVNSQSNTYIKLLNNLVTTVANTFPEELHAYTKNRLQDLTPVVPILKAIALNHSENLSDDSFQIFLSLIRFCIATSRLKEAEDLLKLSENYLTKKTTSFDLAIAERQHYLGVVYFRQGQYQQAEDCFQKEISIRSQVFGEQYSYLADSINSLGAVYLATQRYDQAKKYFSMAIALRTKENNPNHEQNLQIANSLNGIADALSGEENFIEAEKFYSIAIEFTLKFSSDHIFLAASKIGIANIHARQRQYEIAQNLYQEAIVIIEKIYGKEHPELAQPKAALAAIYLRCGQQKRGQELYQEAIDLLSKNFGDKYYLIGLYQADISAWNEYIARGKINNIPGANLTKKM